MTQPRLWVDEIRDALSSLGGSASLSDIYAEVWRRNNMDFIENPHWKDAIRRTIQQHSSDSSIFTGISDDDVCFAPLGLRAGVWALRI